MEKSNLKLNPSLSEKIRQLISFHLQTVSDEELIKLFSSPKDINHHLMYDTLILHFTKAKSQLNDLENITNSKQLISYLIDEKLRIYFNTLKSMQSLFEKKEHKQLSEFIQATTNHPPLDWIPNMKISFWFLLIIVEENSDDIRDLTEPILLPRIDSKDFYIPFSQLHSIFNIDPIFTSLYPTQIECKEKWNRKCFYPYTLQIVANKLTSFQNEFLNQISISYCYLCKKKFEKISQCSKCHFMKYCSKDCQRKDKIKHQAFCLKVKKKITLPQITRKEIPTQIQIDKYYSKDKIYTF